MTNSLFTSHPTIGNAYVRIVNGEFAGCTGQVVGMEVVNNEIILVAIPLSILIYRNLYRPLDMRSNTVCVLESEIEFVCKTVVDKECAEALSEVG